MGVELVTCVFGRANTKDCDNHINHWLSFDTIKVHVVVLE